MTSTVCHIRGDARAKLANSQMSKRFPARPSPRKRNASELLWIPPGTYIRSTLKPSSFRR